MEDIPQRASWLQSENATVAGDIFGEPQKIARIGDQYQAKIPSLITENERLQLIEYYYPTSQIDVQNQINFGLSIPVEWVRDQHKKKESENGKKVGILGSESDNSLLPIPGSSGEFESWSVIEHDSFVLGLYIFGKNLRLVNKFVGNKGMPNVICYYYGKFYRTGEHQKWSTYRKKKSKKAMPGKKIFNGWRRQELLSRLLPNITDECKMSLTQVTRMFEEGKLSFEKYVLTISDMVGIDLLVEAVAIGKQKRDLTSRVKKPRKTKNLHSACSSLEPDEIVNLLKNGIGLSNARLHDLFWEAVWPRLLAKGWHSEQPRNYTCQNSKQSLVFLPPGVTKFTRRSLEKGKQYFESFTQVLNKVVSEPQLLEHEHENEPDQDKFVEPGSDSDVMKCTIVDTSLIEVVKVRELRSFPVCEYVNSPDCETVRKLKFVFKPKSKRYRVTNTKTDDSSYEDEPTEDQKKRQRIVIDLNSPRVGSSLTPKPSVLVNGQRHGTRNRPMSTKALEALATGFVINPKKKRGSEDKNPRRVRAKTALVSSCGARSVADPESFLIEGEI